MPHFIIEALFHFSRLFYFADKTVISGFGFSLWAVTYVLVRLYSMIVIVLTFWFGLADGKSQASELEKDNFNTYPVRMGCLIGGSLIQIYLMWNYLNFQLKRLKEKQDQEEQAKKKRLEKETKKEEELSASGGSSKRTPQLRKRK